MKYARMEREWRIEERVEWRFARRAEICGSK
jgi:hypothetical protein